MGFALVRRLYMIVQSGREDAGSEGAGLEVEQLTLAELLGPVTEENLQPEVDTSLAVGNEAW